MSGATTSTSASSSLPPPPPTASTASTTSPPPSGLLSLSGIGLGNAIAIALGFLVLLSTLLLAFYVCRRRHHRRHDPSSLPSTNNPSTAAGVVLPRIIFVAEGDDDDDGGADGRARSSPAPGLDEAAINSYPKFPFSRSKPTPGDTLCSICLCEYRDGEMLRMLPDCRHRFHLTCVDAWLRLNASCPVCRTSPMPTPLSTPLSELVPLSLYSADRRRR